MQKLSKETVNLIREYRKLYGDKPKPFWFGRDEKEYIEYLRKEIEKFNEK